MVSPAQMADCLASQAVAPMDSERARMSQWEEFSVPPPLPVIPTKQLKVFCLFFFYRMLLFINPVSTLSPPPISFVLGIHYQDWTSGLTSSVINSVVHSRELNIHPITSILARGFNSFPFQYILILGFIVKSST